MILCMHKNISIYDTPVLRKLKNELVSTKGRALSGKRMVKVTFVNSSLNIIKHDKKRKKTRKAIELIFHTQITIVITN